MGACAGRYAMPCSPKSLDGVASSQSWMCVRWVRIWGLSVELEAPRSEVANTDVARGALKAAQRAELCRWSSARLEMYSSVGSKKVSTPTRALRSYLVS